MPTIDRNQRARMMAHAEALDRRTRERGRHGGVLKRTGLAVYRALLFHFANVATGRCDPSYEALRRAAGVCRSTVAEALKRLEAAGLVERIRRQVGTIRYSNAYRLPPVTDPAGGRAAGGRADPRDSAKSGFRGKTTYQQKNKLKSARTVPAVPPGPGRGEAEPYWMSIPLEEARAGLARAKEIILRRGLEREARERLERQRARLAGRAT